MQREIKFKAISPDDHEWYEGFVTLHSNKDATIYPQNSDIGIPVIESTICQFSGLRTKDNIEIYEFDKVLYKNYAGEYTGIVKFGKNDRLPKEQGFYIEWENNINFRQELRYWVEERHIKVIGNVYDIR